MPTFENPNQDADELAEAARGLAYATRHIETPADTYDVLGSLHLTLSRVQQGLQQLAAWHQRHAPFAATDNGNRAAGHDHAITGAAWLATAAESVEDATRQVMAAHSENGRIAWHPTRHIPTAPHQRAALSEALAERAAALDPPPASDTHPSESTGLTR